MPSFAFLVDTEAFLMGQFKYSLHLLALISECRRPRDLLYQFVSILTVLAMNLLIPQICSFLVFVTAVLVRLCNGQMVGRIAGSAGQR
jgi:hypothetical protein